MTRWDAARAASKRSKRWDGKMHGPVGERPPPRGELRAAWDENDIAFAIACKRCGHDVCSCAKPKTAAFGCSCRVVGCRSDAPDRFAAARARTRDIIDNGYGYDDDALPEPFI
jgi:hypothetical protein